MHLGTSCVHHLAKNDQDLGKEAQILRCRRRQLNLKTAIQPLHLEPQRMPSPFLGKLTKDEWDRLHMRHAELHLSFFVPE